MRHTYEFLQLRLLAGYCPENLRPRLFESINRLETEHNEREELALECFKLGFYTGIDIDPVRQCQELGNVTMRQWMLGYWEKLKGRVL